MDIIDLIKGCKEEIPQSQKLLVQHFAPRVLAICQRYCRDKELAKDALQEAFINIFKYINTLEEEEKFLAWASKIAANVSIALYKKYNKLKFVDESEVQIDFQSSIPDIYNQINIDEIHEILKSLQHGHFMVFMMHAVEGYTHKEIGETLGIAEGTSRSILSRARMQIINQLQPKAIKVENQKYHSNKIVFSNEIFRI